MQATWETICCIKIYKTKTIVFYNLYKWEADTPQNAVLHVKLHVAFRMELWTWQVLPTHKNTSAIKCLFVW